MSGEDRVPRVTYQDGSPHNEQELPFAPRMCMVEDFDHHNVSSVRDILNQGDPSSLYGAATAWDTLADQLADLMGTVNSITQPAKDSWSGEQSADDLHEDLRRVYANADSMRTIAQRAASMSRDSADTLSDVKEHFVDSDEHAYNPSTYHNNDHAKDSLRDLVVGYTNATAYGPDSLAILPTKIGNIEDGFTPVPGSIGTGPGGSGVGGGPTPGGYGGDGGSIGDPSFVTNPSGLPTHGDYSGDGPPIDSDPNAAPVIGDGFDPTDPDDLSDWDADDLGDWGDEGDVWDGEDGYDGGTALAGFDPSLGGAGISGGPGGPGIHATAPSGFGAGSPGGGSGPGMSPLTSGRPGGGVAGQPGAPGMMPPGGLGAGGGKNDKDRERTTWLVEDRDVWSPGDDLPPAVIGADAVGDEDDAPRPRRPRRPRRS